MTTQSASRARSTELALLVGLALALPLFEAPKNVLWVLYVFAWFATRLRSRDFGGPWNAWDTVLGFWVLSGFVVAAFAGISYSEWGGALDPVRYVSILWLVRRGRYRVAELTVVLLALIASAAVALGYGYWQWGVTHARSFVELKSVGHVNHSSIYLAIVFGSLVSVLLAYWSRWTLVRRVAGLGFATACAVSLVVMESRGAIGVAGLLVVLLALAWGRRSRALAGGVIGAILVGAVVIVLIQPPALIKHTQNAASDNTLSFRDSIWRAGLVAWERYPLFGVGMDNYSRISMEHVREWKEQRGEVFEPERHRGSSHAHSLYINTLAERGLVGGVAVASVLALWLLTLVRAYPAARAPDEAWLFWGASFSAWFVTVGVGTVNTTLHHEHGILATLVLGLWLAYLRGAPRRRATA